MIFVIWGAVMTTKKKSSKPVSAPNAEEKPLEAILDTAKIAVGGTETDLKTLVEAFGNRAFGPVMILCSLFLMTPIGAIPGLPAAFGLIIIVFALQLLFQREHPWMPDVLRRIKISDTKLEKTRKFITPFLRRIDNVIKFRLPLMTSGPAQIVTALISIILALTMIPLGVVPFGVLAPAFIIGLFGLGITARDGVLIILGFALSLGVAFGVTNLIF